MAIRIILLLLFLAVPVNAEIYWQDDFDGFTSGWTPSVGGDGNRFYPWTTDETYDPEDPNDDGGGSVITNYEPSIYAANQRKNSNSWNGWVQYTTSTGSISIQSTGGVNNSPVLRMRLVKHTGLSNEIGLNKWLGNTHYQELYIKFMVKFGSTGEDFAWNGSWSGGDPQPTGSSGNVIWKFGRVWTGFNPIDYDRTGGQTQPYTDDATLTNEENWRCGIWIFRWMANDWNTDANSAFTDVANFHFDETCESDCYSGSPSRNPTTGNIWDWANTSTSYGRVNTWTNSGNGFDSDGTFSEAQGFHEVIYYFKNRSAPGTADGDLRIWIDGNEITSEADVSPPILASTHSNSNDYGMNFIRFGDNFNNLTRNIPESPGYIDVFIDDIIIASTYAEAAGDVTAGSGQAIIGSGTVNQISTSAPSVQIIE